MNTIVDKTKKSKKLYEKINLYTAEIPKFNKYSIGCDVINKMKNIETNFVDLISKQENSLDSFKSEQLFELWNQISEIMYDFKTILSDLEYITIRHQKKFVLDFTETYVENINELYGNIIIIYNEYKKDSIVYDIEIIKEIYQVIYKQLKWDKSDIKDTIDIVTTLVKKYPHSISLYAYITQQAINTCLTQSSDICEYIINQIEMVKDYIMLYEIKNTPVKKNTVQSNPNIKTFGLTPNGPSNTLSEITKKIFNTEVASTSKLSTLASKEKICIVVINRIVKHPIEFSLWKLTDWKIAQEYIQSSDMGINQKVLDRFTTIEFKDLGKGKKWNFDVDYFGSIDSNVFVVIENLSYNLFRALSIYNDMPITGGGVQELKIKKDEIKEFIEYIKNDGIYSKHTRISEYNKIQEKKILDNMFMPIKFSVEGINVNSQIIDSKFLRHTLYLRILEKFNEIVKTEYKNGDKINNTKDFGHIVHSEKLINVFNSIIMEQYDIYTFKNRENISEFPYSETFQTFLADIYKLNADFKRKIHDNFVKIKIDKSIYSEAQMAKKNSLQKIFEELITFVLGKLISDKSNIYQSLIYKTGLLNLQLVKPE